jgi:alpha-glucosidase
MVFTIFKATTLLGAVAADYQPTEHGFRMSAGDAQVEVAIEGQSAFRVSIAHSGDTAQQLPSRMLEKKQEYAQFDIKEEPEGTSLSTQFGSITLNNDASFKLSDSQGNVLVQSDVLTSFDGTYVTTSLGKASSTGDQSVYYGAGAEAGSPMTMDHCTPTVCNHYSAGAVSFGPQYYAATDKYAALAVATHDWSANTDYWTEGKPNYANYVANWTSSADGVKWMAEGSSMDLYLMPAADTYAYLKSFGDLTGKPRVPPRYAFGFFAGRWGWTDQDYIGDILTQFRDGKYPADAFISDFEFFTYFNDYDIPPEGNSSYEDFGWSPVTFPEPEKQLKEYQDMGFKMGGIRKPRFGNPRYLDHLRENDWLLPEGLYNVNGQGRNANLSAPEAQKWLQEANQHYLDEGVSFWWNDEGEAYYYQFHDWNQAQWDGQKIYDANKRYFSLNRVFTPGMQRFGSAVWTGDISVSWESMAQQPLYLQNYNLAGNVYTGCDTGGFVGPNATAELLSRWYWSSAFFTIMRVHSSFTYSEHADAGLPILPHFPFLYGEEAGNAMRKALEMRYRMIPMLYSLGHEAYRTGAPITRPLLMEFGTDPQAVPIYDQWLIGSGVMTAPVLAEGGKRSVYLPVLPESQQWFEFDSVDAHAGGATMDVTVPLDASPVYVRSGTVVPLGPVVQHTGELPGDGTLEVQVYAGADGSFTFVEDDGDSYDYERGHVRSSDFTWTDASRTFSWSRGANHENLQHPSMFTHIVITFLSTEGRVQSPAKEFNDAGEYSFDAIEALV